MPREFAEQPRIRGYFEQLQTIIFQLWQRTGGEVDLINESNQDNVEFSNIVGVDFVEDNLLHVAVVDADYETRLSQIVVCTVPLTVTLNTEPDEQERVTIHAMAGKVVVDGNGITINGNATATMTRPYTTWDLIYILEQNEWVIT
jgi:hypothetical protein